jgi:hypothetical protein
MSISRGYTERTAPLAGLEPATTGLEVRCSIHLSYRGKTTMDAASIRNPANYIPDEYVSCHRKHH